MGQSVVNHIESDDSDLTFNAGLLAHLDRGWQIGLVYRQGASLRLGEVETVTFTEDISIFPPRRDEFSPGNFEIPSVFGLGASVRATRNLLVLFEWDRVGYSSLPRPSRLPRALSFNASGTVDGLAGTRAEDLGSFRIDDAVFAVSSAARGASHRPSAAPLTSCGQGGVSITRTAI